MKKLLSALMAFVLITMPCLAQTGCVIPGATTVVETTSWSPLAADTGKVYWANCSSACTITLPATTPPTAVWRFDVIVIGAGTVTVNPNGLQIDQQSGNESFGTNMSFRVSTDGTNYFTSARGFGETYLGSITYTSSGTTTFAAGSTFVASGSVTATHSTSTTLSPTGLIKGGSYTLEINQDSTGGGVTFTLGTAGSCSAWKIGGGGSGAITLSTSPSAIDVLAWTFDGTNCIANFRTNFN